MVRLISPRVRTAAILAGGVAAAALLMAPRVASASLVLDLSVSNYNATTGVWTDTSANGDNASAAGDTDTPTIQTNATPNGSSAVAFNNANTSGSLTLTTPLDLSGGFTILAFAAATANTSNDYNNILSGGNVGGTSAYAFAGEGVLVQSSRVTYVSAGVHSNTNVALATFASIGVYGVTDGTGVTFLLNGATDGSGDVTSVDTAQNTIGFHLQGEIAEVQVYNTVLDPAQIAVVEADYQNSYVNSPVPEPASLSLLALGGMGLLIRRKKR